MKHLKTLIGTLALVCIYVLVANAAAQSTPAITVSAAVGDILDLGVWVNGEGGAADDTMNFGTLVYQNGKLESTYWFEVNIWVNTNYSTWTLTSLSTALSDGSDNTLPVGGLQVNGPITGGKVNANTGSSIDISDNSTTGTLTPDGAMVIVYSMGIDSNIPATQASGTYTGTTTITVTAN